MKNIILETNGNVKVVGDLEVTGEISGHEDQVVLKALAHIMNELYEIKEILNERSDNRKDGVGKDDSSGSSD
jgi:hypothetical protein